MENKHRAVCIKRKNTLKKKAQELSTLCGIPVCLLYCAPDGDVETWPQDSNVVYQNLVKYYRGRDDMLSRILSQNRKMIVYSAWDPKLDYLPEQSLRYILEYLNDKVNRIELTNSSYTTGEGISGYQEDEQVVCPTMHDSVESDSFSHFDSSISNS